MKTTLIMLDNPILVSDEQPVKGWYFDTYINKVKNTNGADYAVNDITKQIIAQGNEINFSSLSEEECKRIGWVDVNELANIQWGNMHRTGVLGFIEGFAACQKLLNKRYSEEDLRKAIDMARTINLDNTTLGVEDLIGFTEVNTWGLRLIYSDVDIIQSLQQPKSFAVEIEMEERFGYCEKCGAYQYVSFSICNYHPNCGGRVIQKIESKITNGKIKILKVL
jgi:hypothetical protein